MNFNNGHADETNGVLEATSNLSVDYPWVRKVPSAESPLAQPATRGAVLTTVRVRVRSWGVLGDIYGLGGAVRPNLSGPAKFIARLAQRWDLSNRDLSVLLGLDSPEVAADLLRGANVLRGRDAEDRVANLFRIFEALFGLLNDANEEKRWMHQGREQFNGRSCLDIMLSGGIEDLVDVRRWLEHLAGR